MKDKHVLHTRRICFLPSLTYLNYFFIKTLGAIFFLKELLENRTSKNNLKIIFNLYQIEFHMKLALKK